MDDNTTLNQENSSYAFSIKADETFVTARPRYDSKDDDVQGLCSCHGVEYLKFSTYEEAEKLCEAVKNGLVHVPTEITVVGGCSMDSSDPVQVISAMPTCDKKDFEGGLEMFKQLSEEYTRKTGKDLCNFSTDGDATRRQIFNELLSYDLDPTSSLGEMLCDIDLLDLQVGIHNETVSYDPKHLVKRCWTAFINESVTVAGISVKKSDIKALFSSLPNANSLKIDGLIHPKDKQNVPSATEFLLLFIEVMTTIPQKDFPYRLIPVYNQLTMLANVFEGVLSFYVYLDKDISSQLVAFSLAAHSLFYLTRSNATKIIPNQLYHDLQSTFIDALFCCAKAKLFFPDKPLYLVKNGTDSLERVFCLLRMKVKNASLDYLTLLHCIGSLLRCDHILNEKHPDWSRKSRLARRLCLDYSNPRAWNSEGLKLASVDVKALWESGHLKARSLALEKGALDSNSPSVETVVLLGHTLKKPKGKLIGVSEIEVDESEVATDVRQPVEEETQQLEESSHGIDDDDIQVPLADLIDEGPCSYIQVNGKNIFKASVIKLFFADGKLSKERLQRVQGLNLGSVCPQLDDSGDDVNMVLVGDPLLVFINNVSRVGNILRMKMGNVQRKSLSVEDMEKPNLEFTVQFLKLTEAEEGRMFWSGSYEGSQIKVSGRNCSLIKPAVSVRPPDGMTNFYYDKQFLLDWGVQNTLQQQQQQQQQSSSRASTSRATAKTAQKDAHKEKNKCKLCSKLITEDRMRGHIGYHILMKKNVVGEVCGFCGLSSCASKSELKKSSRSKDEQFYTLHSTCPYFYSYGRRPVYSKRSKCSNHLARCQAVDCSADVWKYHMAEHYKQCHPLLSVPESFTVSDEERKSISSYESR